MFIFLQNNIILMFKRKAAVVARVPFVERAKHADVVRDKIRTAKPDLVFDSPIKGDSRVFMVFKVPGAGAAPERSYICYTGVENTPGGWVVHDDRMGGQSYINPRIIYHCSVKSTRSVAAVNKGISRTDIADEQQVNLALQAIAIDAKSIGAVPLEGFSGRGFVHPTKVQFKQWLNSASSLRDKAGRSIIH